MDGDVQKTLKSVNDVKMAESAFTRGQWALLGHI